MSPAIARRTHEAGLPAGRSGRITIRRRGDDHCGGRGVRGRGETTKAPVRASAWLPPSGAEQQSTP